MYRDWKVGNPFFAIVNSLNYRTHYMAYISYLTIWVRV